jgi:hypothetical protein
MPSERIHGRTHGYKGSLLKVRKGKYKEKHAGAQVESASPECMLCPLGAFKTYEDLWEGVGQVICIQ